jgi:stage II sporulation protein D
MLPLLLVLSACAPAPGTVMIPRPSVKTRAATLRVQVREGTALVVREVPLEEYVVATALSEVHPEAGAEAFVRRVFEMQTVIARTYAMSNRGRHARDGFDLCSTTHCQLYEPSRLATSRWAPIATEAAACTKGEVVWFADAPALALFHADCGGHTSSASAVWGGTAPAYLAGERDDGPAESAHAEWTRTTASTLRTLDAARRSARLASAWPAATLPSRAPITLRGTHTWSGEVFRDGHARSRKSIAARRHRQEATRDDCF